MGDKYLDQLKDMVLSELGEEPVKVLLFGSRARGSHRPGSDIDIGLVPKQKISACRIAVLREKIENSRLPYKVDVVDLSQTSPEFLQQALKGAVVWKN